MASTRELRRHIRSIKSTRQITKAMEMVSTAKMRRSVASTLSGRPYAERAMSILGDLGASGNLAHPLLAARPVKKATLFVIASDRGLAGAYNAAVVRAAVTYLRERKAAGIEVTLIVMGKKAESALRHLGFTAEQSYAHSREHPDPADTAPIARMLASRYKDGETDEVQVAYTDFKSALKQEPIVRQLLPIAAPASERPSVTDESKFLYEPSPSAVLDYVLPRLVEATLYQHVQEALSSEHAARRMAMNNASDNAADLIDSLQLTYNGVRQSTITREIAEITAGTETA